MRSIAFINQKGGVGKTSSTLNLGASLSRMGKKVLLIDMDAQANLSSLCVNPAAVQKTIYELIKAVACGEKIQAQEYVYELQVEGQHKLFVIPSCLRLSGLESEIKDHSKRDFLFKEVLKQLKQFDYILVDCPPSLSLVCVNILSAVDELYIPVQTEFFALQGLGQILEVVEVVKQKLNPALRVGGIFGTKFNNRKLHKDVMKYLNDNFKGQVLKTVIRDTIAIAESPSYKQDVFTYSPDSNGARDYQSLCFEILASHTTAN